MVISRELQKRIDRLEAMSSLWIAFDKDNSSVHLEGKFIVKELSEIASILRKLKAIAG